MPPIKKIVETWFAALSVCVLIPIPSNVMPLRPERNKNKALSSAMELAR
jgi:hypothetical protein